MKVFFSRLLLQWFLNKIHALPMCYCYGSWTKHTLLPCVIIMVPEQNTCPLSIVHCPLYLSPVNLLWLWFLEVFLRPSVDLRACSVIRTDPLPSGGVVCVTVERGQLVYSCIGVSTVSLVCTVHFRLCVTGWHSLPRDSTDSWLQALIAVIAVTCPSH